VRTTVTIDDALLEEARELTEVQEVSTLVRMGLTALIQREAARQLALLGGTMPDAWVPPRRRFGREPEEE
jgi:Arc/MetJ family transcription regulator